jgi:arsenate reductase-like glutaredoxin family protein
MRAAMDVVIYHHPDCGTSRNVLRFQRVVVEPAHPVATA